MRRYIVQAVHDLWEIHPAASLRWDEPVEGEELLGSRSCKLILIGTFLKQDELKRSFESCFSLP